MKVASGCSKLIHSRPFRIIIQYQFFLFLISFQFVVSPASFSLLLARRHWQPWKSVWPLLHKARRHLNPRPPLGPRPGLNYAVYPEGWIVGKSVHISCLQVV
jgi:hypothetical protein